MRVHQVMTRGVITTSPETPIREAARLLVRHGISGLPVVDARGSVVGILSDGDLIIRQKPRERVPWWRSFFDGGEALAREYQKAVGTTVGEVMTRAVVCVSPDLPIEAVATILDARKIRRLPVVADGRLVGVVSRGDLVKALADAGGPEKDGVPASDAQLVRETRERMKHEPWSSHRGVVVQAREGIVSLWGVTDTEAEKSALETLARAIPGVRGVDSHIVVQADVPYLYWA